MNRLPIGITNSFPKPSQKKSFFRCCHAVARKLGAVAKTDLNEFRNSVKNFELAKIELRNETVDVLCVTDFGYLAFCQQLNLHEIQLNFIDVPVLRMEFEKLNEFIILSKEKLETSPSKEILANLGNSEIEDIKYWKPQRIGDVIFNFWD